MSSQCTLSLPPVFSGDRGALGKNGLIGSWKWSEVSPFVNPFQVDAVSNGLISSVINQKGESQNGCFKKIKHAKFSEKRTFLTLWYAYVPVRSGGKKCSFFGNFGMLYFFETPVSGFTFLSYYRRYISQESHL